MNQTQRGEGGDEVVSTGDPLLARTDGADGPACFQQAPPQRVASYR